MAVSTTRLSKKAYEQVEQISKHRKAKELPARSKKDVLSEAVDKLYTEEIKKLKEDK